jgi:putative transposase
MEKFNNKYRIPSARLAIWDYSHPGFYFITICTKNRNHFFGEIKKDEMYLNEIGIIADKCWAEIPGHFHNTTLGEFVVMPNHIHGIIIIDGSVETGHALSPNENNTPTETGNILSPVEKNNTPDLSEPVLPNETGHALSLPIQTHFRFRNQGKNTISAMVGSFKSAVTKLSRPVNPGFEWQTRFHDHIVRSHDDFLRISNYILNNPANWNSDKFYN